MNVPETKDRTLAILWRDTQIFARAKEEIESEDKAVGGRNRRRGGFGFRGRIDLTNDGEP